MPGGDDRREPLVGECLRPHVHVHPTAAQLVGIGEPREVRDDEVVHRAPRIGVAERGVEERTLLRVTFGRDRLDDRGLAVEVAVERAVAQPRLGRDVVGGGAVQTPAFEAGDRGVEDRPPTRVAVRVAHLRHQAASATTTWYSSEPTFAPPERGEATAVGVARRHVGHELEAALRGGTRAPRSGSQPERPRLTGALHVAAPTVRPRGTSPLPSSTPGVHVGEHERAPRRGQRRGPPRASSSTAAAVR